MKHRPELLLFTKWDRFSRNTGDAYGMINTLNKLGVDPQAVEQPLDLGIPENKIMLAFYLAAPEVENDRRALNVFVGMRRAKKEGRWMATAPRGYKNITTEEGKRIIVPSVDAPIMRWAFQQLATRQYPIDEIRRQCNEKGLKCGRDNFWQIIKNPVYCGKIFIPAYKDEEAMVVQGIHESIVSEELFYKVQDILSGKKRVKYLYGLKDEFPLRLYYLADVRQKSYSKWIARWKRHKALLLSLYKGLSERHKISGIHDSFSDRLNEIVFETGTEELYNRITKDVFGNKSAGKSASKAQIQAEIQKNRDRLINAQQMMLDGQITPEDYRDIKKHYEPLIDKQLREFVETDSTDTEFRRYLKKGLCLIKNLENTYNKGPVKEKQAILRSILKENLKIENSEVRKFEREN